MSKVAKSVDVQAELRRAYRVIAKVRRLTVPAVRQAIDAIGHTDEAALAVAILRDALKGAGLRVQRATPGKPLVVDLVADKPVAWGEGVSIGEYSDDPWFAPLILEKGQTVRAALFKTARRNAGLGAFSVRVTRAARTAAYDLAFLVLIDEQRIWQVNRRELEYVEQEVREGGTWNRIRRLRSGALRFEMPKAPSDFDLHYRMGAPPRRQP